MNRKKYINNDDYREGYTDGRREGVNTVLGMYKNDIQKFIDDFTEFHNKLIELKSESEEM